jgi:hypothetical protein
MSRIKIETAGDDRVGNKITNGRLFTAVLYLLGGPSLRLSKL